MGERNLRKMVWFTSESEMKQCRKSLESISLNTMFSFTDLTTINSRGNSGFHSQHQTSNIFGDLENLFEDFRCLRYTKILFWRVILA